DLARAICDRRLHLGEPLLERREARRETGRDRRDGDAASLERLDRRRDPPVVDAYRADGDAERTDAECLDEVLTQRATRLRAQPSHVAGGVVTRERREVDERDRAQQPRRLPLLLDRATRRDR